MFFKGFCSAVKIPEGKIFPPDQRLYLVGKLVNNKAII